MIQTLPALQPHYEFLTETLACWRNQRVSAGDKDRTIHNDQKAVWQFVEQRKRFPWQCTALDFDEFGTWLDAKYAVSTARQRQNAVARYIEYLLDPLYDWETQCEQRVGLRPRPICSRARMRKHAWCYEGNPNQRPFTNDELETLFHSLKQHVLEADGSDRKGFLTSARDYALIATAAAWGLRARELAKLETFDLTPAVDPTLKTAYGMYGTVNVRWGKALRRGPPRRRQVLTVPLFDFAVDVMRWYIDYIRPQFNIRPEFATALFVTERGTIISSTYASGRFFHWRERAGLPEDLHLHCLRHTYITRLLEDGYSEQFVREQVGHSNSSVTAIYTSVSDDFKRRIVMDAVARARARQGDNYAQ